MYVEGALVQYTRRVNATEKKQPHFDYPYALYTYIAGVAWKAAKTQINAHGHEM